MNNSLITILLLFLFNFASAQKIDISDRISMHSDESAELIGKIGDEILLFRNRPESIQVIAYDKEMKKTYTKELKLAHRKPKILHVQNRKDNFTVLYKYLKRNKIHLLAHKYNQQSELLDSTTIKVIELKGTTTFSQQVAISRNKRYALIHDSDGNNILYSMAFDLENMELLWNKTFRPSDIEIEKDFLKVIIDNEGNGYFVFEKDNRKSKKEKARLEIFQYQFTTNKAKQYPVSLEGNLWYDVDLIFDDLNKQLLGAGLFTDNRYGEANGTFYLKIDPLKTDSPTLVFNDFDDKFIVSILGKELKNKEGFGEIDIQELVLRTDGGLLMVTERNREYQRRTYNYSNYDRVNYMPDQMDYYYNDIALFSINPEGAIQWKEILRKRQYSQDDNGVFSSYFLVKTKKNLRFLYNDAIKFDTNVNEYKVEAAGTYERSSLLNTGKDNLSLALKEAIQITSNSVIIPSIRRGDLKLVKITF